MIGVRFTCFFNKSITANKIQPHNDTNCTFLHHPGRFTRLDRVHRVCTPLKTHLFSVRSTHDVQVSRQKQKETSGWTANNIPHSLLHIVRCLLVVHCTLYTMLVRRLACAPDGCRSQKQRWRYSLHWSWLQPYQLDSGEGWRKWKAAHTNQGDGETKH